MHETARSGDEAVCVNSLRKTCMPAFSVVSL